MTLSSKQRQALIGASHRLAPVATISDRDVSDAIAAHVRASFHERSLVKVRVATDDAAICDAAGAALAEQVPCELVRRIGRVLILYRPEPAVDAGQAAGAPS